MNYQRVPISSLKQDPNQPRKFFDQDALNNMAVSIKNEGVINPIEVDENFVIVTGERRYRASKIAGLKEVPVKILPKMSEKDRFIRQVQENIHQNTMSAWDTAEALERCRNLIIESTPGIKPVKKESRKEFWKLGVPELSDLFGLKKRTIEESLYILGETGEVKKALQTPGFQSTKAAMLRVSGGVPKEYLKEIRHMVVNQPNLPRDTIRHIITTLNRAKKYGETDAAARLLKEDFSGLTSLQALERMKSIVPDEQSRIKGPADLLKKISTQVVDIIDTLDKNPIDSLDPVHRQMLEKNLNALGFYVGGYLQGRDMQNEEVSKSKLLN